MGVIICIIGLYLCYLFIYKPAAQKKHPKKKYRFKNFFTDWMDQFM